MNTIRWYAARKFLPDSPKLYCFHHAAGTPAFFSSWQELFGTSIEVRSIQLPGRGSRKSESLGGDLLSLAHDFSTLICADGSPHFLFGHSMGALLAFEVARRIANNSEPSLLLGLFVSGINAPSTIRKSSSLSDLSDEKLISKLKNLGGTPEEVLNSQELMQILLPNIRADFKLAEGYKYEVSNPLSVPVVAFSGIHDSQTSFDMVEQWRDESHLRFSHHAIPGEHFFLNTHKSDFFKAISPHLI